MPLTHVRTFCAHHHEYNAHDRVYPAVCMRYAQEAASDASAAAGYALNRHEVLGWLWLAGESEIAYPHLTTLWGFGAGQDLGGRLCRREARS